MTYGREERKTKGGSMLGDGQRRAGNKLQSKMHQTKKAGSGRGGEVRQADNINMTEYSEW